MRKILVTGSDGFLASRFIDFYKDKYEIVSLNRKLLDITSETKVYRIFKENRFDFVFHGAAISDTGKCQNNPELARQINTIGTINIAKGCQLTGATLLFASSDQLYAGVLEDGPYKEDIRVYPNNIYGETKLEAERSVTENLENYYNLRLTWMFSYPERNKRVNTNIITNIVNAALRNKPIALSINEFRGISYAYEVIENLERLIEAPYGAYNFGSENNISTYDIGVGLLNELGLSNRKNEIIIKDTERFKDKKRDLRISNEKLREVNIKFDDTEKAIARCIREFNID